MTFNLLLLNEFPDEAADRKGGRRNLVIIFGRRVASAIYAAAGVATPLSLIVAVSLAGLPPLSLVAALPSLLLVKPLQWALSDPEQAVPIPALGANVVWNLATNTLVALTLVVAIILRG
jgi:1,4-dihydroxy-2-naphthoate octaprenyltransferase